MWFPSIVIFVWHSVEPTVVHRQSETLFNTAALPLWCREGQTSLCWQFLIATGLLWDTRALWGSPSRQELQWCPCMSCRSACLQVFFWRKQHLDDCEREQICGVAEFPHETGSLNNVLCSRSSASAFLLSPICFHRTRKSPLSSVLPLLCRSVRILQKKKLTKFTHRWDCGNRVIVSM